MFTNQGISICLTLIILLHLIWFYKKSRIRCILRYKSIFFLKLVYLEVGLFVDKEKLT